MGLFYSIGFSIQYLITEMINKITVINQAIVRLSCRSIFLLSLICFIGYANEEHQAELVIHQEDTVEHDTLLQTKGIKTDSVYNQDNQMRTVINFSLLIVIILIFIVAITVFLIIRRAHRVRKE